MSSTAITISREGFRRLPVEARAAILQLMRDEWDELEDVDPASLEDAALAVLAPHQAREFLNNCNDKTQRILGLIIDAEGSFLLSAVSAMTGNTPSELRGAWAGLTKRVRTITREKDAKLIAWTRRGDDWHGAMAAQTTASMADALKQRANPAGS